MLISKQKLHILFEASALFKAITSTTEIILGIFFLVLSPQTVNGLIYLMTGDELTEQPRDPFWNFFFHGFNGVTADVQHFWALLFIAHGVVVMFLVVGLIKKTIWIYPAAAIIFACLLIYQTIHIIVAPSLLLTLLSAFDALFIWLIVQEYQYQKK
jgi:uncharacterized membrane protein